MKNLSFFVNLHIYPLEILFIFKVKEKYLKEMFDKYGLEYNKEEKGKVLDAKTRARTIHFYSGQTVIWFKGTPKTPAEYGRLSHEIFHAVYYIMDTLSIKLTMDTDEAYAYMVGYITEQVYEKLSNE